MSTGGGKGKWAVIGLVVVGAGLGGFYAGRPDLFANLLGSLGGQAVPELAASHVKVGYVDLWRDSYGSIDDAVDNFEKAVALAPGYADAMAALAEAHIARAEYMAEEAGDLAAAAEGAKKKDKQLTEKIATLRRSAERRREEAFNYGSQALKIDPDGLAANRAMADYYRLTRANEQMIRLLSQAEAINRDDYGIAYVRGSAAMDTGTAAERAVRYLDASLERAPRYQRARYKLARVHFLAGDKTAAKIQVEAIVDAVPDHERAKALALRLGEPPKEANKDPEPEPEPKPEKPVRERDPDREPGFDRVFNRAERLRRADRPDSALPAYHEALDIAPHNAGVLVGIGWCHLDLEQPTTAISYFNRARAVIPDHPEAHMGLAEAYKLRGMKRDAVRYYRRYLEISPYGTEADVARRMLDELQ